MLSNQKKLSFLERISRKLFLFIFKNSSTIRKYATEFVIKNNILYGLNVFNNVLEFCNHSVKDIMTPRAEIYAVDIDLNKVDFIKKIKESNHTRVPVYKNNIDNIIGFIHVKDVLLDVNLDKNISFKGIVHSVFFIPPSMKIINLFIKMQSSHSHLAIVLDEYTCTEGLVSMVDLIREIVGDIKDEDDEDQGLFPIQISENKFEVSARVLIKEIEDKLHIELKDSEDEDYVTINGLIFAIAGKVPLVNEVIEHKSGIKFLVKEANERCVHKLIIDLSEYNKKEIDV